jgi:hypothetical protein
MQTHTGLGIVVALLVLLAAMPALAAELKSSDVTQDGKRVTLHLRFSSKVEYELVSHYAKNQVILHVAGLKLSKQQLKSGIAVKGNLKEAVNGIALAQPAGENYGEIRLQLEKGFDPGDAQVIPRDSVIDIQFIVSTTADSKPTGSKPPQAVAAQTKAKPQAEGETPSGWVPPVVTDEPLTTLTGQRFEQPLTIAASSGEDPVYVIDDPADYAPDHYEPDDAAVAPLDEIVDGDTSGFVVEPDSGEPPTEALDRPFTAEELAAFGRSARAEEGDALEVTGLAASSATKDGDDDNKVVTDTPQAQVEERPVVAAPLPVVDRPEFRPQPSYRQRDLASVAVNQREFKNMPFREAILDLVAGTGFNVIVGPGIDNETVYLNFKQQQLSLKSALETLCTVYELAYTVTDDVITITVQ